MYLCLTCWFKCGLTYLPWMAFHLFLALNINHPWMAYPSRFPWIITHGLSRIGSWDLPKPIHWMSHFLVKFLKLHFWATTSKVKISENQWISDIPNFSGFFLKPISMVTSFDSGGLRAGHCWSPRIPVQPFRDGDIESPFCEVFFSASNKGPRPRWKEIYYDIYIYILYYIIIY